MYTIAMAYAGTGNNKAIRTILHVAVSRIQRMKQNMSFKLSFSWKDIAIYSQE